MSKNSKENVNPLTTEQFGAIKRSIDIGRLLQYDYPEIGDARLKKRQRLWRFCKAKFYAESVEEIVLE